MDAKAQKTKRRNPYAALAFQDWCSVVDRANAIIRFTEEV